MKNSVKVTTFIEAFASVIADGDEDTESMVLKRRVTAGSHAEAAVPYLAQAIVIDLSRRSLYSRGDIYGARVYTIMLGKACRGLVPRKLAGSVSYLTSLLMYEYFHDSRAAVTNRDFLRWGMHARVAYHAPRKELA